MLTLAHTLSRLQSCVMSAFHSLIRDWHNGIARQALQMPASLCDSVQESSGEERTCSCTSTRYGGEDVTSLMLLGTLTDDRKVPAHHCLLAAAVSTSWPWHISRSCRTTAALLQPNITPLAAANN